MSFTVRPHLNFRNQAAEALTFYQAVFGGDLMMVTYRQAQQPVAEQDADQIIFGQVTSPDGFSVMAFDVPSDQSWSRGDRSFFVSVQGTVEETLQARWQALADGASVQVPMGPSAWSPLYGMLTDRFGVTWVLSIAPTR